MPSVITRWNLRWMIVDTGRAEVETSPLRSIATFNTRLRSPSIFPMCLRVREGALQGTRWGRVATMLAAFSLSGESRGQCGPSFLRWASPARNWFHMVDAEE